MLIVLKSLKLSDAAIYLLAAPTVIPYFYSFWWLDRQKTKYIYVQETACAPEEELDAARGETEPISGFVNTPDQSNVSGSRTQDRAAD